MSPQLRYSWSDEVIKVADAHLATSVGEEDENHEEMGDSRELRRKERNACDSNFDV